MNQKQHIIPQVYLRQFGYKDDNGTWKVRTINLSDIELMHKLDKSPIRQTNIKSLLQEVNIYDIPIEDDKKKQLEEFFAFAETHYPRVIEELKERGKLTVEKRSMLLSFISLLYARTKDYRLILNKAIEETHVSFMIGILDGGKIGTHQENIERVEKLMTLPKKSAINFLIAFSGYYVFKCLQNFRIHIIKANSEEKWATTDNPVYVACKTDYNEIDFMGVDTKVMCPLSPDYLAYIDHKDSKITFLEGFDSLIENQINEIPKKTFEKMWHMLTHHSRVTKYYIIPTQDTL